jgi:hypothetical protein
MQIANRLIPLAVRDFLRIPTTRHFRNSSGLWNTPFSCGKRAESAPNCKDSGYLPAKYFPARCRNPEAWQAKQVKATPTAPMEGGSPSLKERVNPGHLRIRRIVPDPNGIANIETCGT